MPRLAISKRCRSIWLSAPLFLAALLAACGGDSVQEPKATSRNDNANGVPTIPVYTEATTSAAMKASAASGMEIPSLSTGGVDAFIIHTLSNGTLNYCVGYNSQLKASCWTAFRWYNGFSSNDIAWRRDRWRQGETFNGYGGNGDPFQPDPVLPAALRNNSVDYSYQRGHILGSADRLNSKEANGQTFYMTNILPQLASFNEQGIWWNLENHVRKNYDTSSFRDTLFVVKGGTVSPGNYNMVGNDGKLVCPKYYFMALLAFAKQYAKTDGGYFAIAFWMEHKGNSDAVSSKYAITIDELEQRTGIDFFCNLPDDIEAAVESRFFKEDWKLK